MAWKELTPAQTRDGLRTGRTTFLFLDCRAEGAELPNWIWMGSRTTLTDNSSAGTISIAVHASTSRGEMWSEPDSAERSFTLGYARPYDPRIDPVFFTLYQAQKFNRTVSIVKVESSHTDRNNISEAAAKLFTFKVGVIPETVDDSQFNQSDIPLNANGPVIEGAFTTAGASSEFVEGEWEYEGPEIAEAPKCCSDPYAKTPP